MSLGPLVFALVPVAVLIVLGLALRHLPGFRDQSFWSGAEKLAYYCLLPALLFSSVAEVDVSHVPMLQFVLALIAPVVILSIVIIALRRRVSRDLSGFTSVLQGGIRFNTYIGLSLSASLFGSDGGAMAAIVAAILVPIVNVISSLGFEFLRTGPRSFRSMFKVVATNPLVLGCLAGGLWNFSGAAVPSVLDSVLAPLAAASLPIGLLCVGAGLRPVSMKEQAWPIITSTVIKLLILPAFSLTALLLLDIPFEAAMVAMIFQSIATASSGYVMARQLGGDSELMAALIAIQTVLMALTLPVVLLVSQTLL